MALFTDGPTVTIEDLTRQDSSVLQVSLVEGINLTTKLALAHEEVGLELSSLLNRDRTNVSSFYAIAPVGLRNVVVTTAVRLWHTHQTLASIYRDAYFSQLNDRYKAKWNEYRDLVKWAKEKLLETELGVVNNPVSQAGPPSVIQTAAAESAGTFYFSVTYVNAAGEEGLPSTVTSITTLDGSAPDIQPVNAPVNVTGWNLYGGTAPESLFLQNSSALDLSTDSVYYPSSALTSGTVPGSGQKPNYYKKLTRLLQRG